MPASLLGWEVTSEGATKGLFKQKGHPAHLLPGELIRAGAFREPWHPAASPFPGSFFSLRSP